MAAVYRVLAVLSARQGPGQLVTRDRARSLLEIETITSRPEHAILRLPRVAVGDPMTADYKHCAAAVEPCPASIRAR